ncbi:response regulator [Paenibacillus sp. LHD-38]|uniref:response regulator n=1 Tax=Paenibacillus sp. LHD-38 TaxID=3072143 RepID=UPI00280D94E8|nr:response regulator [Paenibacillus sp. LHD-38]MDQ8738047.1 response regulator [Paenibacillus sp. LHD-38]
MYKLLLVDDEPEVTEGLMVEIDWTSCGFTEVKTAGNGKEAMELFEKMEPDVLITDISMPYMNGLELSEWVRKTYPITRIVILSGHDEFEYAKQAIHLQVEAYVLKPFSAGQLTDTIVEVAKRMDEEREQRGNIELLEEHYRTSLPIVREKFLSSLITRKQPHKEIALKAIKYGMQLEGEGYVVSIIAVNHSDNQNEAASETPSISLAESSDLDLKLFSVSNVASEIWARHELGKVFIHQDQVVLFTVSPHSDQEKMMEQTQDALKEILQSIEKFLRFPVMIGVGTFTKDIDNLKYAYEAAAVALDYRRILGNNLIICIDDMENLSHEKLLFDEWKEQSLIRAVKLGTEKELEEVIDGLFDEIARVQAPVHEYQHYLLEMVTAIIKMTKVFDSDTEEIFGGGFGILNQYQKLNSVQETRAWFGEMCAKVRSRIASQRQHTYKQIVEDAISYTKSHFHESDLSIAKVCGQLHISAGYFSGLFKKELKLTFGAYLLQLRMEAAKELLRTTELKAFEIADKVGFADPNYFSLSFKKYAGVSAKEYRSGLTEQEK